MDVMLYVGNLSESTSEEGLRSLFTQAGDATGLRIMRGSRSGQSRGCAYLAVSAQSEADKAVSRFNACSFDGQRLKVSLAGPRLASLALRRLD
jgi:RNA recognition motif-containing protein